jgi:hypothetical protein
MPVVAAVCYILVSLLAGFKKQFSYNHHGFISGGKMFTKILHVLKITFEVMTNSF